MTNQRLVWGATLLDRTRRELRRDGELVPLQALVYRALEYFVDRPGIVISRDELLDTLWPDATVSDAALNQLIRKVRRALGPDGDKLATVRGFGYRLDLEPRPPDAPESGEANELERLLAQLRHAPEDEAIREQILDHLFASREEWDLRALRPLLRDLHDFFASRDIRQRARAALLISSGFNNHEKYVERVRVLRPLVAGLAGESGPEKVQVFRSLAFAEMGRGDFDAARTYADGSVQAAAELEDLTEIFRANECAAYVYARAADADSALRTGQTALDAARRAGRAANEVVALGLVARAHALAGDFGREVAAYEEALAKARVAGLSEAEMEITGPLGVRYADHGRVADALRAYRRTLELAQECADDRWVIVSHVNVAQVCLTVRDPDTAARHLARAAALDGGFTKLRSMREYVQAGRLRYLGDPAAIEAYLQAAGTAAAVPDPSHEAVCRADGALAAAHFGRGDEADRQIEAVLHGPLDHHSRAPATLAAGCIALRAGRRDAADALFVRLLDALRPEQVLQRAEALILRAAAGATVDIEALRALVAETDHRDLEAAAAWIEKPGSEIPLALEGVGCEPYASIVAALG